MNIKGFGDDFLLAIAGVFIIIVVLVIILSFFGLSFTDYVSDSMQFGEDFFEPFKS